MTTLSVQREKKLVTLATQGAVVVATILILCKLYAWVCTNAISLQASLVDSLLDLGASLVNMVAIRQALKPADAEHRFGHGKAEAIAGLAQSMFIIGSALWLLLEAFQRIYVAHVVEQSSIGSVVMIFATALTAVLIVFQQYVVKKTNSLVVRADSLHYKTDLLTNIAVLVSLNLTAYFSIWWIDAVIGAGIAFYIFLASFDIVKHSLDVLMDKELDDEVRETITALALSHEHVLGIHELKTRSAGHMTFIQLHLDLQGSMSLREAHVISDKVEHEIRQHFPHSEIIIHQDPR